RVAHLLLALRSDEAGEGVVGHGREAGLVASQGEQQVGDAVRWRQLSVGGANAEAVHPPPADEQRPRLSHEPHPELAPLHREPGIALERAGTVAEQVAQEALRHLLTALVPRALRPDYVR